MGLESRGIAIAILMGNQIVIKIAIAPNQNAKKWGKIAVKVQVIFTYQFFLK